MNNLSERKISYSIIMMIILLGVAACGGGSGSDATVTIPTGDSDCVIEQSQIGSCTLG